MSYLAGELVRAKKDENSSTHFFGSIVNQGLPDSSTRISRGNIVDGQQRFITLSLLLAALRDVNKENSARFEEMNGYLVNHK